MINPSILRHLTSWVPSIIWSTEAFGWTGCLSWNRGNSYTSGTMNTQLQQYRWLNNVHIAQSLQMKLHCGCMVLHVPWRPASFGLTGSHCKHLRLTSWLLPSSWQSTSGDLWSVDPVVTSGVCLAAAAAAAFSWMALPLLSGAVLSSCNYTFGSWCNDKQASR